MPKPHQLPNHVGLTSKLSLDKKIKELVMKGKFSEAEELRKTRKSKK
jgi:hypothetical protein